MQKQPRFRLTEPVNALFHITDVEIQLRKLFVLLRRTLEPVEDALLNGAHVLIFIHEYRVEPGGFQLFELRVAEHAQREMLQIVKIQRGRVGLFLLIGQMKGLHGSVQPPQGRNHGVHIVHRRFQPNGQKCLQGLDAVLVALAQGLVPFDKAHLVPGDGLDPGNGDEPALLQPRHHGGKALPHSFRQGVQRVQIGFDGSVQPFGEAAFLRQAAAFVPDPHHAFQHQRTFPKKDLRQRVVFQIVQRPRFFRLLLQPSQRVGPGQQERIHLLHHLYQLLFRQLVKQRCQLPLGFGAGVQGFQCFLLRVPVQALQRALVPQPELRVDLAETEMFPDDLLAIGMNGGDLRLPHQLRLTGHGGVAERRVPHGGLQPVPQLGGGGTGIGHHQHPVDGIVLVPDQMKNTPHQYGGLAAARRGGYQQLSVFRVDGALLFRGKIHSGSVLPNDDKTFPFIVAQTAHGGNEKSYCPASSLAKMPRLG